MSVNDIIFNINQQIKEEELVPILNVVDEIKVDKEQVERFCEHFAIDINHVYYTPVVTQPFVYFNFPVYAPIMFFDFTEEKSPFDIDGKINFVQKAYDEQSWHDYLLATEGCCSAIIFNKIYPLLPKEDKYVFLKDFYVDQYHGHTMLTKEMWKEALESRPADYVVELPCEANVYTIYRGSGSKSASIGETFSWSLDAYQAIKFAYRDSKQAVVTEAKVKKEHIVDYINDRNESEVLVLPKNVMDIKEYPQQNVNQLMEQLNEDKVILEYAYYKNSFLGKEYFLNDSTEHGFLHSKRVLYLALTLAYLEGLSLTHRAILANVAMYHDIGRTNDGVDDEHGRVSLEEVENQELTYYTLDCLHPSWGEPYTLDVLMGEDIEITNRIIEYHSLSDAVGLSDEAMKGLSEEGKQTYQTLYSLFKDADGLDRVRFHDLDLKYLRNDISKELLTYALTIQSQIN